MNSTMRFTLVVPAVVGGLLLTGCGASTETIDPKKAETLVKSAPGATGVQSVSCPSDVEAVNGDSFKCTVTYVNGQTSKVTVHIDSDDGHITFNPSKDVTPPA